MIPNATSDFLKVTHFFSTPTRPVLSIQTYWTSSPATAVVDDSNIKDIADGMHDNFGAVWKAIADSVCTLSKTRATWYGPADDGFHQGWTTHAGIPGDITELSTASDAGESDALPDWDALLVAKNTGKRRRQSRGRIFIPCIAEDASMGGVLQAEYFSEANAIAGFIAADQVIAGMTFHARHWNKKDNLLEVITQALVMQTFSTRRDRRVRGLNLPT